MAQEQKEFGNIEDVADMLHVTPKDINNLMRRGALLRDRHFTKHGRTKVFHLPAIMESMRPPRPHIKTTPRNNKIPGIPLAQQYKIKKRGGENHDKK